MTEPQSEKPRTSTRPARDVTLRGRSSTNAQDRKTRNQQREELARAFAIRAAQSLKDDKCEDVLVLDLRGLSDVTDFFVIGSGSSERQMRSCGEHIRELGAQLGIPVNHTNLRGEPSTWIILDHVDVVVHIFDPEQRAYYDLEMLWGDAPRIEWRREKDFSSSPEESRNRAGLKDDEVLEA